MKTILVIRLSSMGDVMLTMPILAGLCNSQEFRVIFLTNKRFIPYFTHIRSLELHPFEPDGKHRGVFGLLRLYSGLNKYRPEVVFDLHSVVRTIFLGVLFRIRGIPVHRIKKPRKARKEFLSGRQTEPVPHTLDLYSGVFIQAGIPLQTVNEPLKAEPSPVPGGRTIRVGFAPFSRHPSKTWIPNHTRMVVERLALEPGLQVFLFGGKEDLERMDEFKDQANVTLVGGVMNPAQEIEILQSLDLFISMDSANMHLASLAGIPVISIWGGTDPGLGFAPVGQPADRAIFATRTEVDCRPCSVYGSKPCSRKDHPFLCMELVTPEMVLKKVFKILNPEG